MKKKIGWLKNHLNLVKVLCVQAAAKSYILIKPAPKLFFITLFTHHIYFEKNGAWFVSNSQFFYIYARFLTKLGLFNGSSQIS
ncbi:MAG: hypothetical protein FD143_2715 [Ignavibacteria bacterium]|nr:MAG: hypothetical protein FD143_2715 [Ignavibacteria bacterium]KAF0157793.1 MAG: hypothetical protein FD188_2671 [Ignavibacteria bacterium]